MTKIFKTFLTISFVATVLFTGGPLWAQTGDGQVPAIEDVCDGDPFSFGLCNAYCEALDCDSDTPIGSPRACDRVLNNYMKKSNGEPPPCEQVVECPCEFDLEGDLQAMYDAYFIDEGVEIDESTLETFCETVLGAQTHIAQAFDRLLYTVNGGACTEVAGPIDGPFVSDPDFYPDFSDPAWFTRQIDLLGDADVEAACAADLQALCDAAGNP